jgi:hypothetical protein
MTLTIECSGDLCDTEIVRGINCHVCGHSLDCPACCTEDFPEVVRIYMSPEALAIAERHAAEDRDTLARLLRDGHVLRDAKSGESVAGVTSFRLDIERRVHPAINLALRSKKRRR